MLKKFLAVAMLVVTSFMFTACGDDSSSEAEKTPKAKNSSEKPVSMAKPQVAADKAIEDWAMIQIYGTTGDDNAAAASTGIKPADIDKKFKEVVANMANDFQEEYLLNEENASELAVYYLAKAADSSNLTTSLEEDDDTNPVVQVTFAPVDNDALSKKMNSNKEFVDFMQTVYEAKNNPNSVKEFQNNEEYQELILEGLKTSIFDEIPVKAAKSIDMTCEISKGYDGKTYWTPKDPNALARITN